MLLAAQRNGYVYILDRTTGEVLSATPFVRITASKGVDLKTGRLITNEEKKPHIGKVIRDVAPASPGGKDWQPCAWSPRTKLALHPASKSAMDYEGVEASYIAGTPYVGVNVKMYAGTAAAIAASSLRLGSGREEESLGDQRRLSGVERHARHRRGRHVLRHDGRLV